MTTGLIVRSVAVLLLGLVCGAGPQALAADDDVPRLAALQAQLAQLESATQRLEALSQIQRIGRAYGYYVDKGYFGEAADLFTDDASLQWSSEGVFRGKAQIRELLTRQGGGSLKEGPGLPFGRLNLRMQLQPVITVADDGRTARARWREWGLLGEYRRWANWGDAIIEDRYVREGAVWKIAARHYFLNFEAPYIGGWASLQPSGQPESTPRFPTPFVPPYHYEGAEAATLRSAAPATLAARPADALGQLEAAADARALALARAQSVRAIENLQGLYGYYIDKARWSQAAALFSRDGSYEAGQGGVYVGSANIARGLSLMGPQGQQPGWLNNYVMAQPVIHVAADNRTAKARWRSDVMLASGGQGRWGGGVYENEYVNEAGVWKFSKLHYHVTFWGDYEQGWTAKPIPMTGPSTTVPPDRPPSLVYQSFPKLQVVPFHYADLAAPRPPAVAPLPEISAIPATLQPLLQQLQAVGERITRQQDLVDVEIVQNAYGYYVDKAQWQPLSELFAPDGTLEIGGKGVFTGRARVFEYMNVGLGPIGPRDGLLIDHQQFQCLPTILPDGVTARARCIAFVMSSGGWGHNYYENLYTKQDGAWRLQALHGPFNMYSGYKVGWLDNVIVNTFPEKFPPWPDLPPTVVYLTYPSYYIEPFHYPNPVTERPMSPPSPRAGGMAFGR
jgi:SnoaL-like domain